MQSADDIGTLHETLLKEGPKEHLEGYQDQARPLGWLWQAFLDPDSLTKKLFAQNFSCRSKELDGPSFTFAAKLRNSKEFHMTICNSRKVYRIHPESQPRLWDALLEWLGQFRDVSQRLKKWNVDVIKLLWAQRMPDSQDLSSPSSDFRMAEA